MILVPNFVNSFPIKPLANHRLNDDEFFDFCQLNEQLKIERDAQGNILLMSLTGGKTGNRNFELYIDLGVWNRKNKLGYAFDSSTGFKLPNGATRSPDVAWIEKVKWDNLTENQQSKFPPICPDFIVELMSNTDELKEAIAKMNEWMENGCRLAWLIYPKGQEIRIFRENNTVELLTGFDISLSGEEILPDFEFDLSYLIV